MAKEQSGFPIMHVTMTHIIKEKEMNILLKIIMKEDLLSLGI